MDRAQKKAAIETTHEALKEAAIVIVSHNTGLTVTQTEQLRGAVRKAEAKYKVGKNRLTKLALAGTAYEALSVMFKGPTSVAYADNDPVGISKALVDFAKKNEQLVILGGALGDRKLAVKDIEALAELPSLDALRAKIIAMIQTPATRIAGVLQAPAGNVARVISAHAKQG